VAVTGPRRNMFRLIGNGSQKSDTFAPSADSGRRASLRPYFPAPFGDMMITGCFGLLAAVADVLPELGEPIRESLNGAGGSGRPPWEVAYKESVMCTRLSDWLHKVSGGWVVCAGLVIFMLFTALVLPTQSAQAEANSGGADTPDLSFYYSPKELYQMAETYGEAGRQAYIKVRFTFDLLWPIVYTLFLVTSISWLTQRGLARDSIWQRANLIPIGAMILD